MQVRVGTVSVIAVLLAGCTKAPPEPTGPNLVGGARPMVRAPSAQASVQAESPPAKTSGPACWRAFPKTPETKLRNGPDPACPEDPDHGPPMVPFGRVSFPEAPGQPALEVEVMLNDTHRERGLMYRKQLPEDHGMLFAWPKPSVHTFWMHNTCLPLDMLFIDQDGFVTGIVENAPTLNDDGRSIDCAVPYVLEVNAGWSRRNGVAPKQRVRIEGVPNL